MWIMPIQYDKIRLMPADLSQFDRFTQDAYNHVVFNNTKNSEIYVVGGSIRDSIIGRKSLDRDYIVRDDVQKVAGKIAEITGGRHVQIGTKKLQRIILKEGATLDFTSLNQSIENDLAGRDFTMNAMAWSPGTGLIDLFSGVEDIRRGSIRVVREENLDSDPVRILRAYRLAGETLFNIDNSTRETLRRIADKLQEVKPERITLEFFKILNLAEPSVALGAMHEDGILKQIICLTDNEMQARLHRLGEVNELISQTALKNLLDLNKIYCQDVTYRGLLRLEVLLVKAERRLLTLSSRITKRISGLKAAGSITRKDPEISLEKLYLLFGVSGDAALDFLIVNNMPQYLRDLRRFERIRKKSVLSSEEIMYIFKLNEGKILGRAKEFIKNAEFCLKIKTKSDAVKLLRNYFDRGGI